LRENTPKRLHRISPIKAPDIADDFSTYPQASFQNRISPMNSPDIADEIYRISPMSFAGYRRCQQR
jgi:hypothetical protein